MKPEYLQNIPEGWEVKNLKNVIVSVTNGTTANQVGETTNFPVSRIETISTGKINYNKIGYILQSSYNENYKLEKGDILFSHINSLDYVGNCAIYEEEQFLIHGMNLLRIKADKSINPYYLYFVIKSRYFKEEVQSIAKHAINQVSVTLGKLNVLKIPFPPIEVQNSISELLKTKTAAIEKIISARQKLFEIFQEHTETLLFTGGVDENAKKKKSDIFWLPEIPKNWKTEKAKHLFGEISIKNFPNETILSATQDKGVIPRSDIEDGVVMPAGDRSNYKLVEIGEFVISLRSFQGGIEYSGYRGLVSPAYTVLRAKQEIGTSFYKYLFKTSYFIGALNTIITGIRDGKNINYSDFAELILPVPPLEEQIRIGEILDNKQQLIAHYQKEISLLQEYRTRLISDAVFGKFIH